MKKFNFFFWLIVVVILIPACQKSELVGEGFTGSESTTRLSDLDESIDPDDLLVLGAQL